MIIQYYLIHGVDKSRGPRMISQFEANGIDPRKVKWVLHPNKDELTPELVKQIVNQNDSYCCGVLQRGGSVLPGQISCTYKHYLALKDMVENNYEYGIIMEDNMTILGNVPEKVNVYIQQLNKLYPDWDILFDYSQGKYTEHEIVPDIFVYPKSNEITEEGHGGTRCAPFYLLNQKCAKKLYDNYLPFNHAPDWWMNEVFRKVSIKSFWAEPPNIGIWKHVSTAN